MDRQAQLTFDPKLHGGSGAWPAPGSIMLEDSRSQAFFATALQNCARHAGPACNLERHGRNGLVHDSHRCSAAALGQLSESFQALVGLIAADTSERTNTSTRRSHLRPRAPWQRWAGAWQPWLQLCCAGCTSSLMLSYPELRVAGNAPGKISSHLQPRAWQPGRQWCCARPAF